VKIFPPLGKESRTNATRSCLSRHLHLFCSFSFSSYTGSPVYYRLIPFVIFLKIAVIPGRSWLVGTKHAFSGPVIPPHRLPDVFLISFFRSQGFFTGLCLESPYKSKSGLNTPFPFRPSYPLDFFWDVSFFSLSLAHVVSLYEIPSTRS